MDKQITSTVDYAIDLGTSDSVIACKKDAEVSIIENYQTGDIFTPSAVWIDENDNIQVGKSARDALITDSENAYSEFKLNMGFPVKYHFKRSNKDYLPEELSAQILKNLKKSAYIKTGDKIDEVIITIPANSSPLNINATTKAARQAGFRKIHFILEPVAASIAYGLNASDEDKIWMIYDLGGGTFDVCFVKASGDSIEKLADSGIDNIGGVMFDWMIVDEIFKSKILHDLNLDDFIRSNPEYKQEFYRLKQAAEQSKKNLSYNDTSRVIIKDLFDNYDFKYTLTKKELEDIIRPFINTTINTCNDLMWQLSLNKQDIDRIILVGGSTLTPLVMQSLKDEYNTKIEKSLNPLTVVAHGASLYASTISKSVHTPSQGHLAIVINDIKQINKNNMEVSGRVFSKDSDISYNNLQIKVYDEDEIIATKYLNEDASFNVVVPSNDDKIQYHIQLMDKNNKVLPLDENSPNTINCQRSIKTTQTLQNTIQILLNDGKTLTLVNKNEKVDDTHDSIIYKTQKTLYTSKELPMNTQSKISIPIYSGKNRNALNNTQIGKIEINSSDINGNLPVNSKINLTLTIDNQNNMIFTVDIPHTKNTLKHSFKYMTDMESLDKLNKNYKKLLKRLDIYGENEDKQIKKIIGKIYNSGEIEYLKLLMKITQEDENCIKSTQDYINHINNKLDSIDEEFERKLLIQQIDDKISKLKQISTISDKQKLNEIITQYDRIKDENISELDVYEKIYYKLIKLYVDNNLFDVVKSVFFYLRYNMECSDGDGKIEELIKQSLNALNTENYDLLLKNVILLYNYNKNNKIHADSDVIIY